MACEVGPTVALLWAAGGFVLGVVGLLLAFRPPLMVVHFTRRFRLVVVSAGVALVEQTEVALAKVIGIALVDLDTSTAFPY